MFVFLSGKNKKEKKSYQKIVFCCFDTPKHSSQPPGQHYLLLWTADINMTWKCTSLHSRDDSTKQLSAFTSEEQNWQLIQVTWTNLPFSSLLWPQREVEALMSTNKHTRILVKERQLLNTWAPFSPSGRNRTFPFLFLFLPPLKNLSIQIYYLVNNQDGNDISESFLQHYKMQKISYQSVSPSILHRLLSTLN